MSGFSKTIIQEIDRSKILGIRAGSEHRFTAVWPIVVQGRLFIRSWNDKITGWRQAFLKEPHGAIQLTDKEIAVRAKKVRGEKLLDAIDEAYALKYNTSASKKWVRGLITLRRRNTTTELVPR